MTVMPQECYARIKSWDIAVMYVDSDSPCGMAMCRDIKYRLDYCVTISQGLSLSAKMRARSCATPSGCLTRLPRDIATRMVFSVRLCNT